MNQNASIPWYNKLPPKERLFFIQLDKDIAQLEKDMNSKITSCYKYLLGKKDAEYSKYVQNNKPTKEGVEFYESFAPSKAYKKCQKSYEKKKYMRDFNRLLHLHHGDIEKYVNKDMVYKMCLDDRTYGMVFKDYAYAYLYERYRDVYSNIFGSTTPSDYINHSSTNVFLRRTAIDSLSSFLTEKKDVFEFLEYVKNMPVLLGVEQCSLVCKIWGDGDNVFILAFHNGSMNFYPVEVNERNSTIYEKYAISHLYDFNRIFNDYSHDGKHYSTFLSIAILVVKYIRKKQCTHKSEKKQNEMQFVYIPRYDEKDDESDSPITKTIHVSIEDEVNHSKIDARRKGVCKDRMYHSSQWPRRAFTRVRFGREELIAATICHRKGEVYERPKLLIFS